MRTLFVVLIACGLAISGYLLFRHFELASGSASASACSVFLRHDCDPALLSSLSTQLGIPLAGWGIVFYGTLAALTFLGWLLGESFRSEAALASLVLAVAAAALSIVLFVTMLTGLAPFCPLCAGVHAINLMLVPVCKRAANRPARELLSTLKQGCAALLSGRAASDAAGQLQLLALLAAGLVAVSLYQWVFIQELRHPAETFDVRHVLASFAMGPRAEIPISDDDPRLGPPDAPIQMIVFTDLRCAGCRRFAGDLARFVEGGKVHVVFKHFPLSTACNPLMPDDRHPRACEAAWAAEAARRQGKFWPFHDAMFAITRDAELPAFNELAQQLGLDVEEFARDSAAKETAAKVKADIELGIRLGVNETPTIFLNGRRAPDVRMVSLQLLIASELASQTKLPVGPKKRDEMTTSPDR